jgi:site-specific recombinase XerD
MWSSLVTLFALLRLGLPAVGVHSLRHSAAARMIAAGWTPKAIQQVMGHRSVSSPSTHTGISFETDLDDFAARLDDPEVCARRVENRVFDKRNRKASAEDA